MLKKILRRELDVEIAGTDQKPVLVFDGRGKAIFLHVEINGKKYGWQHLRTGYSLKKAIERFAVLFQNGSLGYLKMENLESEISFAVKAYERFEMLRNLRTARRLSFAAMFLAAASMIFSIVEILTRN